MGWDWRSAGAEWTTEHAGRRVRAWRRPPGWEVRLDDGWTTFIHNPGLKTWMTARQVVEIVVRCHLGVGEAAPDTGRLR